MMKSINKYVISIIVQLFILIAVISVISCDFFNNNPGQELTAKKGELSFTIPTINPLFTGTEISSSRGNTDRTYIFVSRAEFELYDSADTLIDSWTWDSDENGYTRLVTPGTGYSIHVDIYNSYVSSTASVVSGSAAGIDVTAGAVTNVNITCIPNSSTAAAESTIYENSMVPGIRDPETYYDPFKETDIPGGEIYYRITPTTILTLIEITPDADNAALLLVSDMNGNHVASGYNMILGEKLSVYFHSTPDTDYYLGIALYNWTNHTPGSYSMTYSPYTLPVDPYEPNDTIGAAYIIASNTLLSEVSGYGISDSDYNPDYFHIHVDGASGLRLVVDATVISTFQTGHYWIELGLYNASDDQLGVSDFNNTGTKQFTYQFTETGDYYLKIEDIDVTGNVTEYDFKWRTEPGIESWTGPTELEGSTEYTAPVNIPSFEHWYSGTIPSGGAVYYSIMVTPGLEYEIYMDNAFEGSGTFTGHVLGYVWEYNGSEWTCFDYGGSAYSTPLTATPTQSTILIQIYYVYGSEYTYALGVNVH